MRRPGHRAAMLALTFVVLAAWLARLPRGPRAGALNLDVLLYFYPAYEFVYGHLARAVLPLWNPYQLCGVPVLATLQAGTFYPLHAIYLVVPPHVGLAASHAVHLPLAALSMAAFVRRAGLSATAGWLAAVLFALRGLFGISLGAPNYLEAAAWMPLGALGVVEIVRRRRSRAVTLIAVATAMSFLAGYPQPTVYMIYVWAALLAALLIGEPAGVRRWLGSAGTFAGALALGVLAAAVQLAPALELIADGTHRALTAAAMSPFGTGFVDMLLGWQAIAGSAFSWGVTAIALGVVAPFVGRPRALAWWSIVVTALALLLALGERTPLFQLYRALPLLDSFRHPERVVGVADFAFAVAAAAGLDAIVRRSASIGAPVRGGIAATIVVIVVALAWTGRAPEAEHARLAVFGALTAGLALAHAMTRGRRGTLVAAGFAVVATAEVLLAPWRHVVTYDSPRARYERFASDYRAVAQLAGSDRAWFIGRGVADGQPEHARKLATRYGFRTIDDYEPLTPRRQAQYFTYLGEGMPEYRRPPWLFVGGLGGLDSPPGVPSPAARRRLLDLAAVRFVFLRTGLRVRWPDVDAFLRDAGLVDRPVEGTFTVLENPHALPRAYVVHRTRPAPEPAALLEAISQPSFDPLVESYVETPTGLEDAVDVPRGEPARVVVDEEHAVEVDATLSRPGLVVLADAFYPGWRATVDGAPAHVVATNHLFRGVVAPAGTHRIRWEYRPSSVAFGVVGSLLGWIGIALMARRKVDTGA